MKFEDKMQISRPNVDEEKPHLDFSSVRSSSRLQKTFREEIRGVEGGGGAGERKQRFFFFSTPIQLMPTFSNLPIYNWIKSFTEYALHRHPLGKQILTFSAIHL